MTSRDVVKSVWESTKDLASTVHHQCGLAIENIMSEAINRRTLDNITVVMICFQNFKQKLFPDEKSIRSETQDLSLKESDTSNTQISQNQHDSSISATNQSPKKDETNAQDKSEDQGKGMNIKRKTSANSNQNNENNKSKLQENTNTSKMRPKLIKETAANQDNLPKKKENVKGRGAAPVSDVNLEKKRVAAQQSQQTVESLSKSVTQNSEDLKRSLQNKSRGEQPQSKGVKNIVF